MSKGGANSLAAIWLDVNLMESGCGSKESFFFDLRNVQKPSQAILPVFFKQIDAGVVTRSAFEAAVVLNPQLGRRLKILSFSEPYVTVTVCMRDSLDMDLKKRHVEYALKFHEDPRRLQTYVMFKINRIALWEPSFLDNVRDLIEKHRQLDQLKNMDRANQRQGAARIKGR